MRKTQERLCTCWSYKRKSDTYRVLGKKKRGQRRTQRQAQSLRYQYKQMPKGKSMKWQCPNIWWDSRNLVRNPKWLDLLFWDPSYNQRELGWLRRLLFKLKVPSLKDCPFFDAEMTFDIAVENMFSSFSMSWFIYDVIWSTAIGLS